MYGKMWAYFNSFNLNTLRKNNEHELVSPGMHVCTINVVFADLLELLEIIAVRMNKQCKS